jgi:hypothetical protein
MKLNVPEIPKGIPSEKAYYPDKAQVWTMSLSIFYIK